MYKALITDLDGTAVAISSLGEDIDDDTHRAVQDAIQRGKKITCATGREWEITRPVVQKLGIVSPCIVEGGTRIIDPQTEQILWEKSLNSDDIPRILSLFHAESSEGMVMHSADITRAPLATTRVIPSELRFLYLLNVREAVAIAIANKINELPGAIAHFTPSWADKELVDIHVTHREATKQYAIHVWQDLENVTIADTIGMGDSGNDVPIFQSSGFRVAVGSGTAELKELADYIAPPVDEQALSHVIHKFLI